MKRWHFGDFGARCGRKDLIHEFHPRNTVNHAVVGFQDGGKARIAKALDDPEFPERFGTIEGLGHDPPHEFL